MANYCGARCSASKLAHDLLAKAVDHPLARERNQGYLPRLTRLETHSRASRDAKAHAARLLAFEFQCGIGFEEMIVRADLDWPVASVGNRQIYGLASAVKLDFAFLDELLARYHACLSIHLIGSCTVTSFVPSGNEASTWISWI